MFLSLAIVIEFLKAALRCGDAICLILVEKARFVQAVFDGHRPLFSGPGILQFHRAILAWSETYSSRDCAANPGKPEATARGFYCFGVP